MTNATPTIMGEMVDIQTFDKKLGLCAEWNSLIFSRELPWFHPPLPFGLELMSASQPISFVHQWVNPNHALIQSLCPNCGNFVAASANQKNLTIAETAHMCPCRAPKLDSKRLG
jgi:hypothetical protein